MDRDQVLARLLLTQGNTNAKIMYMYVHTYISRVGFKPAIPLLKL
jgi:hypothetical protein